MWGLWEWVKKEVDKSKSRMIVLWRVIEIRQVNSSRRNYDLL